MIGPSPRELGFRVKAKHRNARLNQFIGIKSRAFLQRDSFFRKIAATYAVDQRSNLLD